MSEIELIPLQKESPAQGEASRGSEYKEGLAGPPSSASDGALVAISSGLMLSVGDMLQGVNRDFDGRPFGTPAQDAAFAKAVPWVVDA